MPGRKKIDLNGECYIPSQKRKEKKKNYKNHFGKQAEEGLVPPPVECSRTPNMPIDMFLLLTFIYLFHTAL